jgi:hypothetical protein
MGKTYVVALFTVLLMAICPARLCAQDTEADKVKNASAAFDREDYSAAMPLYSQLLALHPTDPNYSYRFGVCMLFASADKGKALPFLEDASKNPKCEIDVWFYLGRAYHLNYRFDEAIVAFTKYKTLAGEKKSTKLQVDNQIAMCKTGKKLLKAVTDITVLEKKELAVGDFFRAYNLEGYSGQLLVKGDEFKTKLDKQKNETSIIFLSSEKNTLYFSSYGENEENGKDIYRVVRLPTGGWSKPYNIGYPINTEYDEDYPFLHPNGKVLYFCSKGHNSMGGYDIFRSELNEETGTWQKPTNMDFAINSPDDDILFVTDYDEKTAWFASARNSPQGFMTVYHVVIERKPVNMCIIAGTFKPSGVDPTANAKITVRNEETNQPVGVYNSNSSTGKYVINLPNTGGKYTFTVEKSGIHTQTKTVLIPPQYELKPIRQEIFYTETSGEQNLNVVTYFDDDTASFAPEFLMDKANLDVSSESSPYEVVDLGNPNTPVAQGDPAHPVDPADPGDSSDIPGGGTDPAEVVPSSQGTVTTAELVQSAFDNADATKQEATETQQQADRGFSYAAGLNQQAKDAQAKADALPEGPDKQQAQAEANALQSQTVAAFQVATALNEDAKQKGAEAKVAQEYAVALQDGSKKTGPHAMDAANAKEQELNDVSDVRSQAGETSKNLHEQADQKREALQVVKSQLSDAKEEKAANLALLQQLRSDSAKEKDPDLRDGYHSQIEGVQESIADNDADIAKAQSKVNRMENELNGLDNQAAAADAAITASKDPAVAPVAMSAEDKKALSENVVAYENRVEDNSHPTVYAPVVQQPNTQLPNTQQSNTQQPNTQQPDAQIVQPIADPAEAISGVQETVNQKIEQAGNESDPVKKEQLIGDAHRNAEKQLDSKIASAQSDLKSEKNPARQDSLKTSIKQYQQEKVRQHDLASASDKRAQQSQSAAVVQNPVVQPIADGADVIADVDGAVSEKIQEADSESDPVKKEQLIGDAHREAEQQLDAKIVSAQNDLKAETNPARQDSVKANIKKYQEEKIKQHDLAVASDKRAKEAQPAVAVENRNPQAIADPADVIADIDGSVSEKIQEAESETDPVKKEQIIGEAHRDAEQQLDQKIASATEDLKVEKSQARQDSIKGNIARFKEEKVKQHDLALASDERAQESQSAVASVEHPEDPFVEYITGIADADTISDPVLREKTKGDVYTDWSTQLDSKIADDKKLLSAAKTKTEKDSLKQLIAVEQQQSTDLKKDAKEAKTAEQNALAEQNSPAAKSERYFDSQISETNTNSNTAEREDIKEGIYNAWADSLDGEADKLDAIAAKERNTTKKGQITQQAQTLRTEEQEKRDFADASHVAANNARTSLPVVQQPNTQQPTVVVPGVVEGQQPSTQNAQAAVVEDNVTYSDPEAQTALTARNVLQSQAQAYHHEQDSLITEAGKANGEEKTELLADASEAQRQAWAKEADASAQQGIASTEQFNTNENLIDGYKAGAAGISNDKIEQAGLVNDEALVLLQRAKDKRAEAKLATSPYQRSQALGEAEDFEQQALVKQQQAIALYKEAGVQPNAVAQNPNTQDPNARVENPGTQQPNTQNPVVQQPTTQQPNTQQPVVQQPTTQQPNTQSPVVQQPTIQQPNTQQPVVQQPTTQQPNTQQPVVQQPNTQQSVVQQPNAQQPNTQNPVVQQPADGSNTSRVASQLKPGETFKITSQPNAQPIPVDPPVPSGIVYKVQVGAFRNPIPVDQFKGIQPLTAESVGNGITRYTAGLFTDFANADAAKREIRAMGYSDAFVVAYKDGKRISVAEARGTQPNTQQPNVVIPSGAGAQQPNTQQPNVVIPSGAEGQQPNTQQPTYQNVAPAVDVATTKELFYTVQVGVYSRPVSSAKLYNLTGLFSEKTPNGYIRYAAGKYNNQNAAIAAKDNIVNTGIKDAFVTAYFEGQRITLERAAELEKSGVVPAGNATANSPQAQPQSPVQTQMQQPVAPTWQPETQQPQTQTPVPVVTQPVQQPVVTPERVVEQPQDMTPIPVIANTKPNIPDTGLVFCVQLGAYQQFVPIAMANRFLLFASKGVSIYRDANSGLTVYQVGTFGNYKDAASLKDDAVSKGINDAFIVAWYNGEKISMEEAMKLRPQ